MRTTNFLLTAFAGVALLVAASLLFWQPSVNVVRIWSVALQGVGMATALFRVRLRILIMTKPPSLEAIRLVLKQWTHEIANRAKGLTSVERDFTLRWAINGDALRSAVDQLVEESKKRDEAARREWWVEGLSASLVLIGVALGTWPDKVSEQLMSICCS